MAMVAIFMAIFAPCPIAADPLFGFGQSLDGLGQAWARSDAGRLVVLPQISAPQAISSAAFPSSAIIGPSLPRLAMAWASRAYYPYWTSFSHPNKKNFYITTLTNLAIGFTFNMKSKASSVVFRSWAARFWFQEGFEPRYPGS
jgi:hypothetical protein